MWMPTFAVPKLGLRRKVRNNEAGLTEAGLTLIELMVAMAIIATIFVVSASGLRQLTSADLKNSASQMASILRYLSNKAVTEHIYLRVVYDLDAQSYWVEESREKFLIVKEETTPKPEKTQKKEKEKEEKKEEKEETKEDFAVSESKLLKKKTLPNEVRFKDVYADYLEGKRESGQVHTYFFPDGYATGTIIHLHNKDDEEDLFSIELQSLSGKVRISREYVEKNE